MTSPEQTEPASIRHGKSIRTRVSWGDKTLRGVEEIKSGYFNNGIALDRPQIHMMSLEELAAVEYLEEKSESFLDIILAQRKRVF